jgi:hypothetical protein
MTRSPARKRGTAWIAAGLIALLAAACDLSENAEPARYISILAPDSLLAYDTVVVMTMAPGADSVLDTIWNAPLERLGQLEKLPAGRYHGGAMDVLILGMKDGWAGYSLKVAYRAGSAPRLESAPPWDTLPPRLTLRGPDSAGFREGQAMPDTGAECVDEHPGARRLAVAGTADPSRAGIYELRYACRDRAGNVSRRVQAFVVSRWPDTLGPELRHPADSALALAPGTSLEQRDFACRDDRDSGLAPIREGALDTEVPGEYRLAYHCADSAGNRSADWVLKVRVLPWPDHVPPQIALAGPDTISIYERAGEISGGSSGQGSDEASAFADPGAQCHDGQEDGVHDGDPDALPVERQGAVDPHRRGTYPLLYQCSDRAGNAASVYRWVIVARAPDPVPPVLRLKGPDSAVAYDHEPYADSGADCADARDGKLAVAVAGEVDVAAPGEYELRFTCADTAGNEAEAHRAVRVVRRPDTGAPVLTLKGPDSLDTWEGTSYTDSGASCKDDRDGALPVAVAGLIDTGARGTQTLRFACADTAGNAAERVRKVRVIRVPDSVKPAITLTGSPSPAIIRGDSYADAGATCLDDRDGNLPVTSLGTVDPSRAGIYPVKYACADSAGNQADTVARMVTVALPLDTVKPVLTLRGPDSVPVLSLAHFDDPGASCADDRDGTLPAAFAGFDPPSGPADGIYRARYACADKSGNNAVEVFRVVKSGLYTASLGVTQDASLDTTSDSVNHGYVGMMAMRLASGDEYASLQKFDLSKVEKSGLKSAKVRFVVWARGSLALWPGTAQDYSIRLWAVKRSWTEGTGNWFYYDGFWKNGGDTWFARYSMSDAVKANSTDPFEPGGVTGLDRDLVRASNLSLMGSQTVNVRLPNAYAGPMAPPEDLRVIEIDVTDYVRNADPSRDFGFIAETANAPDRIGILSREVNDGQYATRLMLTY